MSGADENISVATESTYKLTWAEVDHTVKVKVDFTDDDGYSESGTSLPTGTVTGVTETSGIVYVPENWALIPPSSSVGVGDRFRLLFVTSGTRDATATDIADYNLFVQLSALSGHAAIQEYAGHFRALATTASVSARSNTGTTSSDLDTPIYWLNHSGRADDNLADFYDGTRWRKQTNAQDENGNQVTFGLGHSVWTGTTNVGEISSNPLGSATPTIGRPGSTSPHQFEGVGRTASSTSTFPLYSLSMVFEVESQVDIQGRAVVGQTLTADTGGITDSDGLGTPTYGYQWLHDGVATSTAATSTAYTLVDDDAGARISVRVSFTDAGSNAETRDSLGTSRVIAGQRKLVGSLSSRW